MSRNPLIEAIHEARYDLQTCAEKDKPAARAKLFALLHQAALRARPPVSPEAVLDALHDDYKEFQRVKRRQGWPKLQRSKLSLRFHKSQLSCGNLWESGQLWATPWPYSTLDLSRKP